MKPSQQISSPCTAVTRKDGPRMRRRTMSPSLMMARGNEDRIRWDAPMILPNEVRGGYQVDDDTKRSLPLSDWQRR